MKAIADFFLSRYESADFIIQRKARALMFFCIWTVILMALIFISFVIFMPHILLQAGIVIWVVLISGLAALAILKTGRYYLAANFIFGVMAIGVSAGLMVKLGRDVHNGYSSFIYFMIAILVATVLFCRRSFVLAVFTLFLVSDIAFYFLAKNSLEGLYLQSATVGMIDSSFSLIFTFAVGLFIMIINKQSLGNMQQQADQIRESYSKVQDLMQSIAEVSRDLTSSSQNMNTTASAFSENTQSQAATTEEIMASIEEVSAGVDTVAGNARDQYSRMENLLGKIHEQTKAIAEMGTTTVRALSSTKEIVGQANSGGESMKTMSESMGKIIGSSEEMKNIVGIINDISDKINLLSLNAAIEAARAGEHGRGFAVVADEIGKLADQTSSSIKEIDNHIKSNNEEISRGKKAVEETVSVISRIIEGINGINHMINDISEKMKRQQEINDTVNSEAERGISSSEEMRIATEEQKTAVGEITRALAGINEATQANSAGAVQMHQQSEQVRKLAETLGSKLFS
ncbi:MAG TPA: methyl-accepting chemotaxis protein [Spirochaetota bacterium]|nr:methyl-accepting chemotaxis protein [Spirochaetota bacterium]